MSEPIKNVRINNLKEAPTPQNTPATANSSYIQRASDGKPSIPTIDEDGGVPALANNLNLLSMIQGKLSNLVGTASDYIDNLPENVKDRLRGLKAIQAQHMELEAELEAEILNLEKKWHAKYQPLYEKRAKIIKGELEPTAEEVEAGKEIEIENGAESDEEEEDKNRIEEVNEEDEEKSGEDKEKKELASDIKGIPDFWLIAFKNHPIVNEMLGDRDDEALHYLTDVRMSYLDQPGFALTFDFEENPFFSNKSLTKVYYYEDAPIYKGEYTFDHAEGTEIKWKSPEQNLTVSVSKRKQRNKRTNATRTVEKTISIKSFFNFFSPPPAIADDDESISSDVENDHQEGEAIKEIIPSAIAWYTGEALLEEDDYAEEEDFVDDDEDDESSDDDDDDDDDSDEEDNGKTIKSGGGAGGENTECKQQ